MSALNDLKRAAFEVVLVANLYDSDGTAYAVPEGWFDADGTEYVVSDDIYDADGTLYAVSNMNIADLEMAWLISAGATSPNVNSAWLEIFAAELTPDESGNFSDDAYAYLGSLGHTGSINTRWVSFYTDLIGGFVFHVLDDVNGSFVADVITGSGALTEANTSTRYYADDSGVWQSFGSGVAGITHANSNWWLVGQKACTNEITQSFDLTDAAWGENGTSVAALDAAGLRGDANGASTLTDNNGSVNEYVHESITIPNNSNTHVSRIYIKKDTDQTRFPEISYNLNGGTIQILNFQINTQTGATVIRTQVGTVDYEVNQIGEWWEVLLSIANNSTGNVSAKLQLRPAASAILGGLNPAATGSIIVGNAELHLNTTIAAVRGSSPLFTAGSTVTINASDLSFDDANHSDVSGLWSCEFRNAGLNAVNFGGLIGLGVSGKILYTNNNTDIKSYDGTADVSEFDPTFAADDVEYKFAVAYGDSSRTVWADANETSGSYDGAFNNTEGKINILANNTLTGNPVCTMLIRDIRRYQLSYTAALAKGIEITT